MKPELVIPFRGDPLARTGMTVLLLLIAVGLAGLATNYFGSATALGIALPLSAPGPGHLLGTDQLGRSLLPRVVAGIRSTFLLASIAVLIAAGIGTLLGLLAGYLRGFVDEIIGRLADLMFSFPAILLAILISAMFRPGSPTAIAAIVIVTLPVMVRIVRAATLAVAEQDFVIQARIVEAGLTRILFVHLLPNVAGAIVVQAAYSISLGMILESGVSFLGLGVQPPGASLGSLLHDGRVYLDVAPWLVFAPGAVLAATILSINLVGDGLRQLIDPLLE
jgi:peptide/nickel transport system permease protein